MAPDSWSASGEATQASIDAEVHYFIKTDNNEPLYNFTPRLAKILPTGTSLTNGVFEARKVTIHSLKPDANKFNLEQHGFQLASLTSGVKDWSDTDEIRSVYYPEIQAVLKQATGASRVEVFDHVTRGILPKGNGPAPQSSGTPTAEPPKPVFRAHVDFAERSGPQRVKRFLGEDAGRLLHTRFAIIQVWKPLRGPVIDSPLALVDASTVPPSDLEPSHLIYPDRVGETYALKYNPSHKWYYYPRIETDQVYLFKCYDSKVDGTRFTPHTAFVDPTAPKDAPTRQSIEARALVFWEQAAEE